MAESKSEQNYEVTIDNIIIRAADAARNEGQSPNSPSSRENASQLSHLITANPKAASDAALNLRAHQLPDAARIVSEEISSDGYLNDQDKLHTTGRQIALDAASLTVKGVKSEGLARETFELVTANPAAAQDAIRELKTYPQEYAKDAGVGASVQGAIARISQDLHDIGASGVQHVETHGAPAGSPAVADSAPARVK